MMSNDVTAAPITCIVTSYNNIGTLRSAVDSVLSQRLPVSELIIADDCSTDGSQNLIKELASKYAVITPILREKNVGVANNRHLAICEARNSFVTHLDGDDVFARGKIKAEWKVLNNRHDVIAFSKIGIVHPKNILRSRVADTSKTVSGNSKEVFYRLLTRRGYIPRDMLFSKELYLKAGGFIDGMPLYEDWSLKLRMSAVGGRWEYSGAIGTLYFQRAEGLSSAKRDRHEYWMREAQNQGIRVVEDGCGIFSSRDFLNFLKDCGFVAEAELSDMASLQESIFLSIGRETLNVRSLAKQKLDFFKYASDILPAMDRAILNG